MKAYLLLLTITSVIPLFFTFIFVHGTRNRLASLRERCAAPNPQQARDEYDSVRRAFPSSLVARMFGFGPLPVRNDSPPRNS